MLLTLTFLSACVCWIADPSWNEIHLKTYFVFQRSRFMKLIILGWWSPSNGAIQGHQQLFYPSEQASSACCILLCIFKYLYQKVFFLRTEVNLKLSFIFFFRKVRQTEESRDSLREQIAGRNSLFRPSDTLRALTFGEPIPYHSDKWKCAPDLGYMSLIWKYHLSW